MHKNNDFTQYLKNAEVIFWDFDGVIKESVEIKGNAFEKLFQCFGEGFAKRVRSHHIDNGGMSRYEKMPLYLSWAGQDYSSESIEKWCSYFSKLVMEGVIHAPWVPGVIEYIEAHSKSQIFYLITATPQNEIDEIIRRLKIGNYFVKVCGSPTCKKELVKKILQYTGIDPNKSLFIGDSKEDEGAAVDNKIEFILRRTALNHVIFGDFRGASFSGL